MPQPHRNTTGTGLTPVPVALLLPPPTNRLDATGLAGLADWCGVTARDVARLIATYSHRDDVVLDLDAHPTVRRAAAHLHRHPATVQPAGNRRRLRSTRAG